MVLFKRQSDRATGLYRAAEVYIDPEFDNDDLQAQIDATMKQQGADPEIADRERSSRDRLARFRNLGVLRPSMVSAYYVHTPHTPGDTVIEVPTNLGIKLVAEFYITQDRNNQ